MSKSMSELSDNIEQLDPAYAVLHPFWNFKPQHFASVATVTWLVGYSNFWYQYDRIYIVFHCMDSLFCLIFYAISAEPFIFSKMLVIEFFSVYFEC